MPGRICDDQRFNTFGTHRRSAKKKHDCNDTNASQTSEEETEVVDWSYFLHIFAFNYGFTKESVMKLTRRQVVLYMERLNEQLMNEAEFEAKLHGFKMSAPIRFQKWSNEDDKRMSELANKRYEEMQASI